MQMIEKMYQLNAKMNRMASDDKMLVGSRFLVFKNISTFVAMD
jgi:hypothetical protein